jgi:hypothetical protein
MSKVAITASYDQFLEEEEEEEEEEKDLGTHTNCFCLLEKMAKCSVLIQNNEASTRISGVDFLHNT